MQKDISPYPQLARLLYYRVFGNGELVINNSRALLKNHEEKVRKGSQCDYPIGVKLSKDEFTVRSIGTSIRSGINKGTFPLDSQSNTLVVGGQRLRVESLVMPLHCLSHPFLT